VEKEKAIATSLELLGELKLGFPEAAIYGEVIGGHNVFIRKYGSKKVLHYPRITISIVWKGDPPVGEGWGVDICLHEIDGGRKWVMHGITVDGYGLNIAGTPVAELVENKFLEESIDKSFFGWFKWVERRFGKYYGENR